MMTLPVPVHAPAGPYNTAITELPVTTRPADEPRGAIVVLPRTESWADAVRAAVASGAAGVILVDPEVTHDSEARSLAHEVTVPVIVERPRLRHNDVVTVRATRHGGSAGVRPNVVTAECEAPVELLPTVVRDAVGWLRVLCGAPVDLRTSGVPDAVAGLALLEGPRGDYLPMPLRWTAGGPSADGWIRVDALGEHRTEIVINGARATLAFENADGRTIAPPARESSPRLALRRAVEALSTGEAPRDLDELAADAELAHRILNRRP